MAAPTGYGSIISDGLWRNNPALVALLGLCPLLATTTSATNGLGMGLATTAVIACSNGTVSLVRNLVRPEIRIPVYVLVIASFVTLVELTMQAFFYELYLVLGLFISLIVVNCTIIGRAEAFASKNRVDRAVVDGLAVGLGATLVLTALGALREFVAQGTLFNQAELLLGEAARGLSFSIGEGYQGALIAILPPGAFFGLGLMIALKNVIDKAAKRLAAARAQSKPAVAPAPTHTPLPG